MPRARAPRPRTPARWPAPMRSTTRPSGRAGMLRVDTLEELFDAVETLAAAQRNRAATGWRS